MTPTTQPANPPAHTALEPAAPSPQRLSLRYCLTLILLPLLAIPASIALGRSNFFLTHGASVWVRSNDAIFNMHDRDCDVLVFGDSTAMTGIDPALVESHTGLRTCNIAVTNAVLAVTDNLTLQHFLAHNPRPRVLLIQLSPDDFQSSNRAWHNTIYAEGLLELLRHGSPAEVRHVLFHHPQESIAFAGYAAGFSAWYLLKDVWFHTTHLRPEEDTVQVRNGFFTPPSPARTECLPTTENLIPSADPAFSRALVAEYEQGFRDQAGLVLVNVAPIPACDPNLAAYSAQLAGITSNSLLPLPIGLFNDGRHYTARGSQVVSTLIARELNSVGSRNPNLEDRVPPIHTVATLRHVRLRVRRSPRHPSLTPGYDLLVFPHNLNTLRNTPQPDPELPADAAPSQT